MSDGSKIEWCDATWQPITGCSVVSAGCKHCGRLLDGRTWDEFPAVAP